MLFRIDGDDAIAIAQPSHAWLSGQLLRAWGGAFDPPSPREEVCLGAELHDIGWLSWEETPTLNPRTGRPHAFHELGPQVHTRLWSEGVRRALNFGHYPALLVSLHADTIYGRHFDMDAASPEDADLVRRFLDGQHRFQQGCRAALAADPDRAADVADATVERNRLLVAAVDQMSLAIGWGVTGEVRIPEVPSTGGTRVELRLKAVPGDPAGLTLDPWPFAVDRLAVRCEGRRLRGRFTDEAALRRALAAAGPVTVRAVLTPG